MPTPLRDLAAERRRKAIDTLSTVGAGVSGVGLGALLPGAPQGLAIALLIVGLAVHLGGMVAKHRLEGVRPSAWWETALYWGCWALICGLAIVFLGRWLL